MEIELNKLQEFDAYELIKDEDQEYIIDKRRVVIKKILMMD